MTLTLTVTSYKEASPSKPASISIEQAGISIGRHKDNSLVLNDPEHVVSSKHAEIEYRNDGYYITDTSTNHTFIDQADKEVNNTQTLKESQSTKLNNNQLLTIGDYKIQVSITSQHSPIASDDFSFSGDYENSDSLPKNDHNLDSASDDPFADIVTAAEENSELQNQTAQSCNSMDDFSFLDSITDSDQMSDNKGMPNPGVTDLFADIESVPEEKENLPHTNPPDHEANDDFSFLKSIENSDQLRVENNTPNTDTIDPFAEIEPAIEDNKSSLNEHNTAAIPSQNPAQLPSSASTEVDPEHVMSFLKGAGIANSGIASTINSNTFYLIGQLLSSSLQGAIQVLWARSKIKSELGLEVTMVHGRRNNPLKFSPSAQESLIKMLDPKGEAYMPANEAIDEAFSDIGAHEMAVMAGMRSALQGVLKRFNPEYLEQRLQTKSPISNKIPIRKQAMLWDLFQDLHKEIEKEAKDDFNRFFGRAFAKAYNDQLRKTQK